MVSSQPATYQRPSDNCKTFDCRPCRLRSPVHDQFACRLFLAHCGIRNGGGRRKATGACSSGGHWQLAWIGALSGTVVEAAPERSRPSRLRAGTPGAGDATRGGRLGGQWHARRARVIRGAAARRRWFPRGQAGGADAPVRVRLCTRRPVAASDDLGRHSMSAVSLSGFGGGSFGPMPRSGLRAPGECRRHQRRRADRRRCRLGFNVPVRRSSLVLGVEADLTFPNYLPSNHVVAKYHDALDISKSDGIISDRPRPRRLHQRACGWLTPPAVLPGRANASLNTPPCVDVRKALQRPARAGPPAPALEYAFAPHLEREGSNISMPSSGRQTSVFPSGTAVQFGARLPVASASASIARSTGRDPDWTRRPTLTSIPESDSPGESMARPPIWGRAIRLSARPIAGTNSLNARAAGPGRPGATSPLHLNARLWEGGEVYYNPELLQGFGIERHASVSPDFPAARRRSRTSPTRTTTPRGCMCARPSDLAASRKSSPAGSSNSRARSTSTG